MRDEAVELFDGQSVRIEQKTGIADMADVSISTQSQFEQHIVGLVVAVQTDTEWSG